MVTAWEVVAEGSGAIARSRVSRLHSTMPIPGMSVDQAMVAELAVTSAMAGPRVRTGMGGGGGGSSLRGGEPPPPPRLQDRAPGKAIRRHSPNKLQLLKEAFLRFHRLTDPPWKDIDLSTKDLTLS